MELFNLSTLFLQKKCLICLTKRNPSRQPQTSPTFSWKVTWNRIITPIEKANYLPSTSSFGFNIFIFQGVEVLSLQKLENSTSSQALEAALQGRTSFAIAHRLSTIQGRLKTSKSLERMQRWREMKGGFVEMFGLRRVDWWLSFFFFFRWTGGDIERSMKDPSLSI